uniref:DUF4216 domain-containing protein n=1 Tax=Steinernema glaseri TaxID=37863 RepID=A0A1I7ZLE2_9BILA
MPRDPISNENLGFAFVLFREKKYMPAVLNPHFIHVINSKILVVDKADREKIVEHHQPMETAPHDLRSHLNGMDRKYYDFWLHTKAELGLIDLNNDSSHRGGAYPLVEDNLIEL